MAAAPKFNADPTHDSASSFISNGYAVPFFNAGPAGDVHPSPVPKNIFLL